MPAGNTESLPRTAGLLACVLLLALAASALRSAEETNETAVVSTGRLETTVGPEVVHIDRELTARRVQDGAWVITHRLPYPANSLVVEADDGSLLLVDTPWTADATKVLLDWLDERFGNPKKVAVNTHFHADALGGNAAFRDARIPTRGHQLTFNLLKHKGAKRIKELRRGLADRPTQRERFRGIEIVAPASLYVAASSSLPLGSESYTLIHPGAGHSPDNIVVYLPERKLLFAGCLVKGGSTLGYLGDADLAAWPDAIRRLQDLDVEVVVIGHGDRTDPAVFRTTLDLLAEEARKPASESDAG